MAALKVVAKHMEGHEIDRLRAENSKLKAVLTRVETQMQEKHDYYEYLVWRARGGDSPLRDEQLRQQYGDAKLAALLRDLEKLANPYDGDWWNGLHAGVMATTRLVRGLTVMEDEHRCFGYHPDWDDSEEDDDDDEYSSEEEDKQTEDGNLRPAEKKDEEYSSEEEDEQEEDDNPRPAKIRKCGIQCYYTAESEHERAISLFPDLDT